MKLAVIGSGAMAEVRALAFAGLGSQVEICGVASQRLERARLLADKLSCPVSTNRYQDLLDQEPDAFLVEVPHRVQDEVVQWALAADRHVLVGGCLATRAEVGRAIAATARKRALVVEAGYEARYKQVWTTTRDLLRDGAIGPVICVRSTALFDQDPHSWYYDEELSGGMLVTHLSYAFLNPLRWLFGTPIALSAFANRKLRTEPGMVRHESCVVAMNFADDVLCTMTAGYVKPAGLRSWDVTIIGGAGSLEVHPGDAGSGYLLQYPRAGSAIPFHFTRNDAFTRQARAFADAVLAGGEVLNPPEDAVRDLELCELIGASADGEGRTQHVPSDLVMSTKEEICAR